MAKLTKEEIKVISKMSEQELIKLHMSMGIKIRNEFGLWRGNNALRNTCGPCHPDGLSGIIIKAVWKALKEK